MPVDDTLATRIGAALSALIIIAVVLALRFDFGNRGPSIHVRVLLSHPGPLKARADLQLGGRKIGHVAALRLVTSHEAHSSKHLLYPTGGVELDVEVQKKYLPWLRLNSAIFVNSRGVIGDSYLEVGPPLAREAMQRPWRGGDEIRGIDPARIEDIIVSSFLNARRFGQLLDSLRPSALQLRASLEELSATLGELLSTNASTQKNVQATYAQFVALRETLSSGADGEASLRRLQTQGSALAKRAGISLGAVALAIEALSTRLQQVRQHIPEATWTKLDTASRAVSKSLAMLDSTLRTLTTISEEFASGIGTIGALINDKEFSDDAKKIGRYIKRHPWKLLAHPL